jgi:hypothetical protein
MTVFSRAVRTRTQAALALALLVVLPSCGSKHDGDYSASGDEPSLREKYDGFPALPASVDAFEAATARAGLKTEERVKDYAMGGPLTCPAPLRASEDIRRRIERCLMIYGKDTPSSSEQYVAFIDAGGSVIYVENWYQYSAR